jgi:hypothetical protein
LNRWFPYDIELSVRKAGEEVKSEKGGSMEFFSTEAKSASTYSISVRYPYADPAGFSGNYLLSWWAGKRCSVVAADQVGADGSWTITGRVTDSEGNGLLGRNVLLGAFDSDGMWFPGRVAKTAADGSFSLVGKGPADDVTGETDPHGFIVWVAAKGGFAPCWADVK